MWSEIKEFFTVAIEEYKHFIVKHYPSGREVAIITTILILPAIFMKIKIYSRNSLISDILKIKTDIDLSKNSIKLHNSYITKNLLTIDSYNEKLKKITNEAKLKKLEKVRMETEQAIDSSYKVIDYLNQTIDLRNKELDMIISFRYK